MQQVYLGKGSRANLTAYLEELRVRSVFVVSGKKVWKHHADTMRQILAPYELSLFHDFSQNPKEEDIYRGVAAFLEQPCDVVLAFGGGSAIDLAKMIHVQAARPVPLCRLLDFAKAGSIKEKVAPLIAIPTTAGTGSEATQFAVFYIEGKKYSADSPYILPDCAIVDPEFTYSMPAYIAACTAADALSQAVESYWSIRSTEESMHYARRALEFVWPELEAAVEGNHCVKDKIAEAAYYAGKAINITRTTAPHAFSYFFTTNHDLPHGHAVALSLAEVLQYNYDVSSASCTDPRGPQFVQKQLEDLTRILSCSSVAALAAELRQKFQNIGLNLETKVYLQEQGDRENFLRSINFERLANNPRKIQAQDLQQIFGVEFKEKS